MLTDPNRLEEMDQISNAPGTWAAKANKESTTDCRSELWKEALQAKETNEVGVASKGGIGEPDGDKSWEETPAPPITTVN